MRGAFTRFKVQRSRLNVFRNRVRTWNVESGTLNRFSERSMLVPIYLLTPPEHIAYVKFIFESYEEVGIIRTADRKKAIIVLLAMDDFLDTARSILDALKR